MKKLFLKRGYYTYLCDDHSCIFFLISTAESLSILSFYFYFFFFLNCLPLVCLFLRVSTINCLKRVTFSDCGRSLMYSEYEIYGHSGPFFITLPRSLHFNSSCSHPVSKDTLQSGSHAGESVSVFYLLGKFFCSVLTSERRPQGLMTMINVLIFLGVQPASVLTYLIPFTNSPLLPFQNHEEMSKLKLSKAWWSNRLMKFHINFGISFFSAVNLILCV